MIKLNRQLGLTLALATGLLVGCGGENSSSSTPQPGAITEVSASSVFAYISNLISGTGENGELVDANAVNLAGDDTTTPTAFP